MEWLILIGFGLIFLSYLGFILCSAHLFIKPLVFLVLISLALTGILIISVKKPALKFFNLRLEISDYLALVIFSAFLVMSLIQSLSPPQQWDEQVYHLLLPKFYLAKGGFFNVPSNIYAWFPQNQEMIYSLLFASSDAISPRLFQYLMGLMVLWGLWNFGRELYGSDGAGIWAMIFFGISGIFHLEATSAYLDLALCYFVLLSVYSAYQFRVSQDWKWLFAAGIFAGGSLGIKYLALGPVLATAWFVWRWSRQHCWRKGLSYLVLAATFLLPWLLHNLIYLGNPIYPFGVGIWDGGEWDQTLLDRYIYSARLEGMGRSWLDYLLLFPRLLLLAREESFSFDARFNPLLFFVSLFSFFFAQTRRQAWLWLWFVFTFILWALGAQHGRYILPGIAVLALIGGGAFQEILQRSGRYFSVILSILALGFSLWSLPAKDWKLSDEMNFLTGRLNLEDYLVRNRDRLGLIRIDELLAINSLTPTDAKLFLLWENRGLYLQRDYLADSLFEVSYTKRLIARLGAEDNFYRWLKANHFSYIYNARSWKWDADQYLQTETREEFRKAEAIYRAWVQKHGQVVFRRQGELIKVK